LFKHPEDRLPVSLAAGLTLIDFALYLSVESPWLLVGYWLLTVVPKGTIGAWSHHHQHVPTFRLTFLNRALELCHALHSGITTNLWLLHHVLGHHVNYLDQTKDESRWRRRNGSTMGALAYTFSVAGTAYIRGFRVGLRYPRHLRAFVIYGVLALAVAAALLYARPLQGLFVFVLPMITSLLFVSWVTHDHHAGLDTQDPYEASMNTLNRRFNFLTGNLGFHTAHHLRPGVHWSNLPALHRDLAHKIPAHLYRQPDFVALLGSRDVAGP
jgi:fatty acid desaturase